MEIEEIKRIKALYPDLTYEGFGVGSVRSGDRRAAIREARERMLTPEAIDQFARARSWLTRQPRTNNINKHAGTSYALKDEAERESGYISNGMFIAAAIACGFKVKQAHADSLNACLNIAQDRPTNLELALIRARRRGGPR